MTEQSDHCLTVVVILSLRSMKSHWILDSVLFKILQRNNHISFCEQETLLCEGPALCLNVPSRAGLYCTKSSLHTNVLA